LHFLYYLYLECFCISSAFPLFHPSLLVPFSVNLFQDKTERGNEEGGGFGGKDYYDAFGIVKRMMPVMYIGIVSRHRFGFVRYKKEAYSH
ncbi:MAG: hypothetical protein WCU00_09135, partial [Candidatus Latescibacterota bacterium]